MTEAPEANLRSGGELRSNQSNGMPPHTPSAQSTNGTHNTEPASNGSTHRQNGTASMGTAYHGHNREEVTRILIQALSDMGYREAAKSVSRDSGCDLENSTVSSFRQAILSGSWDEAEALLEGARAPSNSASVGEEATAGLVLDELSDPWAMRFWIRQQKYLELLEKRDISKALRVLRYGLEPIHQDRSKLHFLSSLMVVGSPETLRSQANWDGASGQSRRLLLSELSKCISPSVMLPENRLAALLDQVKQSQIDTCLYHTEASSPSLYADHSCDRRYFPTEVALDLSNHQGEVWQVQFSHDGSKLAACGESSEVVIWDTRDFKVIRTLDQHEAGVGNISWSPDDSMLVSCSRDKYARLWDVENGTMLKRLKKFEEPAAGCVWAADNRSCVVGSLDKNSLCTFAVDSDEVQQWGKRHRVQDLCGSPDGRWLVAVDDVQKLHVYNAVTREIEYELELKARPTSVNISEDSRHLLVNKRDGEAQLIDLASRKSIQKFLGHTGGDYLIRSDFGGANESFVVSGSEDGNILIWHKNTGAAVERLPGHRPRCNAVSWNPQDPCMLASCGDDGRVKIWSNPEQSYELRSRHPRQESNGYSGSHEAS